MDRRIAHIIIAFIAALLFFLAVGYSSWPSCIIGDLCPHGERGRITGGLLITAGLLILIAGILLIVLIAMDEEWTDIAAAVLAGIAAIFAIAGVFYFLDKTGIWSPFIATIGMSLNVTLAVILLIDVITDYM